MTGQLRDRPPPLIGGYTVQSNFENRKGKSTRVAPAYRIIPLTYHILIVKRVKTHRKPPAHRLSPACRNSATVDSPQIGHAPDPYKPVALRVRPISRPQCNSIANFKSDNCPFRGLKYPHIGQSVLFLLNTQASLMTLLWRRRHLF
jgi:hypothetical protein